MPRWLVFAPLLALVGAAAVFGLTLGWKAATTTETQVIDRIAQRYLAEHGAGAAASDCVARPARSDGLWLVVSCRPARGAGAYAYFVDRFGRLAHAARPGGRGEDA
ncbi:hypothetical protein [Roseovarius salinarum]|uniref:hypothetical protein n=1 Tax=Roseovarius salinarum TaxID=1981892 RepID=UPI000C337B70|nr:hypothetical protein [Roseovarius salinarum]